MPKYTVRWCEESWFQTNVEADSILAAQEFVFGFWEQILPAPFEIKITEDKITEVFVEETKGA